MSSASKCGQRCSARADELIEEAVRGAAPAQASAENFGERPPKHRPKILGSPSPPEVVAAGWNLLHRGIVLVLKRGEMTTKDENQNPELSEIFRHAWNLGINIPYL
jgi:hypothetical protein